MSQRMCRILPWLTILGGLTVLVADVGSANAAAPEASEPSAKDWRAEARHRRRRIIFNNDGNEPLTQMTRPSVQDMLDARTSALVGTHVDSIFYCTCGGFSTFHHFTKVGQVYTLNFPPHDHSQIAALQTLGIDPLRVMVEFGQQHGMEVFWSFRMNDVHDHDRRREYSVERFKFNRLKNEHPEYLMGKPGERLKAGGWSAVNYGLPEIRELAFRFTEEVCTNYAVDGVELDFFRHPVFFKATTQGKPVGDAERGMMTDLVTRIRRMADDVGRKRGRPILIAVRVPDSVEYCRAIGLDLEKWLAGDLVDLLVPSGYFQLNDWEYSVELGHKYDVMVYPSLDESRVRDEAARKLRMTPLAFRGRAADVWASGADGVYWFNPPEPQDPMWRELGDPKVLAGLDCDYFASTRGTIPANGGNLPYDKYLKIETLNPANAKTLKSGGSQTAGIKAGPGFKSDESVKLSLRLQFDTAIEPEALEISINGHKLAPRTGEAGWLSADVRPRWVLPRMNRVEVKLAAESRKPLKWLDLMLEVRH